MTKWLCWPLRLLGDAGPGSHCRTKKDHQRQLARITGTHGLARWNDGIHKVHLMESEGFEDSGGRAGDTLSWLVVRASSKMPRVWCLFWKNPLLEQADTSAAVCSVQAFAKRKKRKLVACFRLLLPPESRNIAASKMKTVRTG